MSATLDGERSTVLRADWNQRATNGAVAKVTASKRTQYGERDVLEKGTATDSAA